jgi:hypothetical protein
LPLQMAKPLGGTRFPPSGLPSETQDRWKVAWIAV